MGVAVSAWSWFRGVAILAWSWFRATPRMGVVALARAWLRATLWNGVPQAYAIFCGTARAKRCPWLRGQNVAIAVAGTGITHRSQHTATPILGVPPHRYRIATPILGVPPQRAPYHRV
jgi:hypothetical protein